MMKARILSMMKIDEELALLRLSHGAALHLFPLSPDLAHDDDDDGNGHHHDEKLTHTHGTQCHATHAHPIHHVNHPIHPNIKSHMSHHQITLKHNHGVSSSSRSIVKKQPDNRMRLIFNGIHTNPLRKPIHADVVMTDPENVAERQLHEVFRKKLTSSDVSRQQDRLLMAKERRGCLGKHNTPSPENRDVNVDMWDECDGRKYSFVHGLWTSNGSYVLKGKWRSFCDFKCVNVGDTIVISMDDSDGTIWIRHERATIELTRRSNTSSMLYAASL